MAKSTKSPRERLSIKRPILAKGRIEIDNSWYEKAYKRFSIALRQPRAIDVLPKNKIN